MAKRPSRAQERQRLFDAAAHVQVPGDCDVIVVGGGAAGLVAAITAAEAGAEVLVLDRDLVPFSQPATAAATSPTSTLTPSVSTILSSSGPFAAIDGSTTSSRSSVRAACAGALRTSACTQ